MNFNSLAQNKTMPNKDIYRYLGEVMGYFIIPGVCIFGVLTNTIFCVKIVKLKKRARFYNILLAKQIIDMLTCLISIGYQNFHCTFCEDQVYNTYFFQFYRIYLLRYPANILYFASILLDILIITDRYVKIFSKKYFAEKFPVKMITSVIVLINIVLFIPDYLAIKIAPTDREDIYIHTFTNIGKTQW